MSEKRTLCEHFWDTLFFYIKGKNENIVIKGKRKGGAL
ncbi:hypothetical protein B4113_0271 [Geobacillus sp. B4113_201601]|nr:hypothetical protein B4113_0271 [Geobacillus sp. B4113_201601]